MCSFPTSKLTLFHHVLLFVCQIKFHHAIPLQTPTTFMYCILYKRRCIKRNITIILFCHAHIDALIDALMYQFFAKTSGHAMVGGMIAMKMNPLTRNSKTDYMRFSTSTTVQGKHGRPFSIQENKSLSYCHKNLTKRNL